MLRARLVRNAARLASERHAVHVQALNVLDGANRQRFGRKERNALREGGRVKRDDVIDVCDIDIGHAQVAAARR